MPTVLRPRLLLHVLQLRRVAPAALLAWGSLACGAVAATPPEPRQTPPAQAADALVDTRWLGTATAGAPPGETTAFGLEIRRSPRGALYALAWVPAMHVFSQPTARVSSDGDDIVLDVLNARLRRVDRDGERLVGTGLWDGTRFDLARVADFPPTPDQSPPAGLSTGPAPRWTRDLGAAAWATPAVLGTTAYLGTADGRFHAVDARTGRELWTWSDTTPIYGAALAADDGVWFVNERSELVHLARAGGRLLWRVALDGPRLVANKIPDDDTYSHRTAAPVLADGTLYVGSTDGGFVALDARGGARRWRAELGAEVVAAAAIDGTRVLVGTMNGSVVALDRANGRELWRERLGAAVTSQPLVAGGLALVGARDYLLHALRTADGGEAWRLSFWVSWVESTPRLADGVAYVGSSDLRAVRAVEPASGRLLWSTDVFGSPWGTPLVVGDRVLTGVVGSHPYSIDHRPSILALDRKTGALLWRRPGTPAEGFSGTVASLVRAGDVILAAGLDGKLLALPAEER